MPDSAFVQPPPELMPRADDLRKLQRVGRQHAALNAKLANGRGGARPSHARGYAEGNLTMREIAKATGLSFPRVSQILANCRQPRSVRG